MASSSLAPQVTETELALIVREYLRSRHSRFPKAFQAFDKESKTLLRDVGAYGRVKSLREIVNGYFELKHADLAKRTFVTHHATRLEPLLLGTLQKMWGLLEDYKKIRENKHVAPTDFARGGVEPAASATQTVDIERLTSAREWLNRRHNAALRTARQNVAGEGDSSPSRRPAREANSAPAARDTVDGTTSTLTAGATSSLRPYPDAHRYKAGLPTLSQDRTSRRGSDTSRNSYTPHRSRKRKQEQPKRNRPSPKKAMVGTVEFMNRSVEQFDIDRMSSNRGIVDALKNHINGRLLGDDEGSLLPFEGGISNTGGLISSLENDMQFLSQLQRTQRVQDLDEGLMGGDFTNFEESRLPPDDNSVFELEGSDEAGSSNFKNIMRPQHEAWPVLNPDPSEVDRQMRQKQGLSEDV